MSSRIPSLVLCGVLVAAFLAPPPARAVGDWRPVPGDDLALQTSSVEPGADAEAIFWEVQVEERYENGRLNVRLDHYLRIKIFTAAGVERHATTAISFRPGTEVSDIRGRTITRDGRIIPLAKDAVTKRTLAGRGAMASGTQTFTFAAVEPGCVIEYRYLETHHDRTSHDIALPLQRDIPVQVIQYEVMPAPLKNHVMRQLTFHAAVTPFVRTKRGFLMTRAQRVPAFVAEPHMPPEDQVRAWTLVYYEPELQPDAAEYWRNLGRRTAATFHSSTRPTHQIQELAARLTATAASTDEKLRRLYDGCRATIRDVGEAANPAEPKDPDPPPNETAAEALDHQKGSAYGINLLFAALARATGFEVRLAMLASRDRISLDPTIAYDDFIDTSDIVVRADGAWRFFDPGSASVPYGMLRWQEEGRVALLCDEDSTRFMDTPISPPEQSATSRVGTFRLSDQGVLEGDVRIELTGHAAADMWLAEAGADAEQRMIALRQRIEQRLGIAEITSIQLSDSRSEPYVMSYHVRLPDYARKSGQRLLLEPSYFTRGLAAEFSSGTRRHPVYFDHPWSEEDTVRIALPAGHVIEETEQPKAIKVEGVGGYLATMRLTPDARQLVYTRSFRFGDNERIFFPVEGYPRIKHVFDTVRERDAHTLSLFDGAARE